MTAGPSQQHLASVRSMHLGALLLLGLAASCGGSGGGGGTPPIALAFEIGSVDLAEDSGSHTFEVVLATTSGPLASAASVTVSDIGVGGATSGADYAAFAPVVVTFPIGAVDGAVQTVTLQLLDDSDVEPPERVTLELSAATGGAAVAGPTRLVVEIQDDEPKAAPFLFVTEDDGTLVASNQIFTLPTTDLGDASAPLRIAVRNLGPSQFDWRPPVVVGAAAGEFQIELVEVDGTPLPVPLPVSQLAPASMALPLLRTSADLAAPGALVPDTAALASLATRERVRLAFPWPRRGDAPEQELTLELTALRDPFASGQVVHVDGVPVDTASLLAHNSAFTGSVVGHPHSRVFLAFSPHGSRGWVQLAPFAPRLHLLSEPHVDPDAAPCRLVFEDALPEGLQQFSAPRCAASLRVPGESAAAPAASEEPSLAAAPAPGTAAMPIPGWEPGVIRLVLETDSAYHDLFASTPAATTYTQQLVAAVSELFERHVQVRFEIVYLALYPGADPWTTPEANGGTLDLLDEFREAYAPILGGSWPVEGELAHLLSGDNLGGGVAYVDVVGNENFAFGVSADLTGSINWGTFTGAPDPLVWDYAVFAHELGHGFGSDHTHEYCPPIDRCYPGCEQTTACSRSTLMSYCHLCPQGLAFVDPSFHAQTANEMRRLLPDGIGTPTVGADVELVYEVRFTPYVGTGVRAARIDFEHGATNLASPFRVRLQALAE